MTNHLFLILFTIVAYGIVRYFSHLIKQKDDYNDKGILSELFVGRLLFFLGLPLVSIFIYDIFKIHSALDKTFIWKGGFLILATVVSLMLIEILFRKFRNTNS